MVSVRKTCFERDFFGALFSSHPRVSVEKTIYIPPNSQTGRKRHSSCVTVERPHLSPPKCTLKSHSYLGLLLHHFPSLSLFFRTGSLLQEVLYLFPVYACAILRTCIDLPAKLDCESFSYVVYVANRFFRRPLAFHARWRV